MPIKESWNNVIDATEFSITWPVSDEEICRLGFPAVAKTWLSEPYGRVSELKASCGMSLVSSALEACSRREVSLVKLEPEDTEFDTPRWYVVFASSPAIARRLDLGTLDWDSLRARLHFPLPSYGASAS